MKERKKRSGSARARQEPVADASQADASQADVGVPKIDQPGAQEQIRLRAYELYRERGGRVGDDLADWLQAEREYLERVRGEQSTEPNPARTTTGGWFTAPKFGSAGSGGAELEPGPERD
jgi:hypothetical protein